MPATPIQTHRATAATYGAVVLPAGDLAITTDNPPALYLPDGSTAFSSLSPLASTHSPALTGTPTTPTAAQGTSTTQIASTAMVASEVAVLNTTINNAIAGLDDLDLANFMTSAALPTCTYANGAAGVGATLTATAPGVLMVDTTGVPTLGSSIVVNNQASQFQNGVYTVTTLGTIGTAFVLTRRADFDQAAEMGVPKMIPVNAEGLTAGTSNNNKTFLSQTSTPFVVGTTGISFGLLGAAYTGDETTVHLAGTVFNVISGVYAPYGTVDTFTNLIASNAVIPAGVTAKATDVPDNRLGDGTTHWLDLASSFGLGLFGDGSDGDVTIAGTVTLTRSMYYRNLTVPVGTTLSTGGFSVYVQNALTWAGTISANGNNAAGSTGGALLAGKTQAPAGTNGVVGVGAVGTSSGNGIGGASGASGAGASGAGAIAAAVSFGAARGSARDFQYIQNGGEVGNSGAFPLFGGGGGPSGAGDGTVAGGGGGGGGGVVHVVARLVRYTAGCIASAVGGIGGTPSGGNCGGGGGGGGGGALVGFLAKVGTLTTQTFTGGAGGAKQGTGVAGSNGTDGSLIERRLV